MRTPPANASGSIIRRLRDGAGVVQIADVKDDELYRNGEPTRVSLVDIGGARTVLTVALRKDEALLGFIVVYRQEVRPFSDRQVALLENFAAQAVIAMENARLIAEQREALEQQTATAEVLQVINASPGNLVPVFDAMLEKAMRLCEAAFGSMYTYDGERFHSAAHRGVPAAYAEFRTNNPPKPLPGSGVAQVLATRRPAHILDLIAEAGYLAGGTGARAMSDLGGIRTLLVVPLVKDDSVLGIISIYRQEVRAFSEKQITLLESFAAQAVIAMENARLIAEQREALEQQTATAEVLQVINASPGNLVPVFDAMLEKGMRLCGAAFGILRRFDGEQMQTLATLGVPAAYAEYMAHYVTAPAPGTSIAEALETGQPAQVLNMLEASGYRSGVPGALAIADLGGARTVLHVPLVKDRIALGLFTLYRQEVRAFTGRQIDLLENFAAQAVIAMENARLLTETREALEQQTATAEVLQVINASPGDLTPVFDTMLDRAMRLCEAALGTLVTYDGERIHTVATLGVPPAYTAFIENHPMMVLPPGGPLARVVETKRSLHILDMMAEENYLAGATGLRSLVDLGGARTALLVPLLKDVAVRGFITIYRQEVRAFSDRQLALLESFAAQAVIAMENARLIAEQREALEQQTVTAEVLQVINANPGNLAPVFEKILENVHRVCKFTVGSLVTYDGSNFNNVARRGYEEPVETVFSRSRSVPWTAQRALLRGDRFVHISDTSAYPLDPDDTVTGPYLKTYGAALLVPLRKDHVLLGYISNLRQEHGAFTGKQIALLENFAAQAVIAMESARLLHELRDRTDELAQRQAELRVTFENMGDGVAMFDETPPLVAWNNKFQEIFNVPNTLLEEHRTYADYIRYLAARGDFGPGVDPEEQLRRFAETAGEYHTYERTRPDGRVIEIRHNPVPGGGFVLIFSDITERKRNEAEIAAARDAAQEATRTIEAAFRDLKTAQANLIQAEKMASLGQLTAGIAHEIKNPLNFVNNFAILSVELLKELQDTAAPGFAALTNDQRADIEELSGMLTSNLEKITEHGKRADGIVKSMLEHSRGASGERRAVDINALADEALNLAYHGARAQDQSFNITLERAYAEGIAPIEVNPQDLTRVFLNLFSNGFYAANKRAISGGEPGFEPTLTVTTKDTGEAVEIRVRDNGTGIPPEIRDKLFQPFFTTKPTGEGTGLGLSITYDIVTKQHGGSIAAESEVGGHTEFIVTLPRQMFANGGETARAATR